MRGEPADGGARGAAAEVLFPKDSARPKQNKGRKGEEVIDKRDRAKNKNH